MFGQKYSECYFDLKLDNNLRVRLIILTYFRIEVSNSLCHHRFTSKTIGDSEVKFSINLAKLTVYLVSG
jgi:hypothetical protein